MEILAISIKNEDVEENSYNENFDFNETDELCGIFKMDNLQNLAPNKNDIGQINNN